MRETAVQKHVGEQLSGVEIGRDNIVQRQPALDCRADMRKESAYRPDKDVYYQEIFGYRGYAVDK